MDIMTAITLFYDRCVGLNLSLETLDNYRRSLRPFVQFLTARGKQGAIGSIQKEDILGYLGYLKADRKYKAVTIGDRYTVLKVFFNFLKEWEYIDTSPMERIRKPKVPKEHARTFTKQEVSLILQAWDKNTFVGYRNYAIMCLLFGSGIRKGELLRLTLLDIHLQEGFFVVRHGKGDKQREIPIGLTLRRVLKKYLRDRRELLDQRGEQTGSLFITVWGKPLSRGAIEAVFKELKDHLKGKGIPSGRLSPHTWRHTFAKFFLLNGGDLFSLQKILGHEDISTTRIYVDYNTREMKVQNEKYNPLDNTSWEYL